MGKPFEAPSTLPFVKFIDDLLEAVRSEVVDCMVVKPLPVRSRRRTPPFSFRRTAPGCWGGSSVEWRDDQDLQVAELA